MRSRGSSDVCEWSSTFNILGLNVHESGQPTISAPGATLRITESRSSRLSGICRHHERCEGGTGARGRLRSLRKDSTLSSSSSGRILSPSINLIRRTRRGSRTSARVLPRDRRFDSKNGAFLSVGQEVDELVGALAHIADPLTQLDEQR